MCGVNCSIHPGFESGCCRYVKETMNNPIPLIIIILILSCTAAAIFLSIRNNRKKSDLLELQNAARKLVKEQNLNDSLLDIPAWKRKGRLRMIVALSWKDKEKESFVYDPVPGIRIGRELDFNQIVVQDDEVSMRHCVLFQQGKNLVLQDLRSTNGTVLCHGLRKNRVRGRAFVYDGDRILLGHMDLKIHLFWIDSAFL